MSSGGVPNDSINAAVNVGGADAAGSLAPLVMQVVNPKQIIQHR